MFVRFSNFQKIKKKKKKEKKRKKFGNMLTFGKYLADNSQVGFD